MLSIRQATVDDLLFMQHTNLLCLPENYQQKYFQYHLMSWPNISFVAQDQAKGRVVGYVLAKLEDDPTEPPRGHITSLAVERNYRRRGIAHRLMEQTSQAMIMLYNCRSVTLHVRASNRAAFSLYSKVLQFDMVDREVGYYADGEDGLFMRRDLVYHALLNGIQPADKDDFFEGCTLEQYTVKQGGSSDNDVKKLVEAFEALGIGAGDKNGKDKEPNNNGGQAKRTKGRKGKMRQVLADKHQENAATAAATTSTTTKEDTPPL